MKLRKSQQGVALLTALMVVALATIAVSSMASKQHFNIRRAMNTYNSDQAYILALSIEGFMRSAVMTADSLANKIDHKEEPWITIAYPQPEEDNANTESIFDFEFEWQTHAKDQQGCFNVNNLAEPEKPQSADQDQMEKYNKALARFERWKERFTDLLGIINVSQHLSTEIFIDWIDENQDLTWGGTIGGAEDNDYNNLEPPYRTAGSQFVDISELRLLKGMQEKIQADIDDDGFPDETTVFEVVSKFLCVLPGQTPLNVNLAPPEIMESLVSGKGKSALKALALPDKSTAEGRKSVDDFLKEQPFQDWAEEIVDKEQNFPDDPNGERRQQAIDDKLAELTDDFTLQSAYFLIHVKVEKAGSRSLLRSLVFRDNENGGETKVISRAQGRYTPPETNTF